MRRTGHISSTIYSGCQEIDRVKLGHACIAMCFSLVISGCAAYKAGNDSEPYISKSDKFSFCNHESGIAHLFGSVTS